MDALPSYYHDLERHGGATALITPGSGSVSYRELAERADELGARMSAGSLLALVCSNDAESVTGYVAALRNGVAPILINRGVNPAVFSDILANYRPDYMFVRKAEADNWSEYAESYAADGYVLLRRREPSGHPLHPDLRLLLTTSGSTGSPKLVRQSHVNICSNAKAIVEYLGIGPDERAITTMPMGYTYGLSIINSHLLAGAAVIMTESTVMQREFWDALRECEATSFGGVPYTYEMLHRLRFGQMELPSLRYLTQAGGALGPETAIQFAESCRKKNMRFIVMYGQAEATARMSYLPWPDVFDKPASIGVPIPGGSFLIIDDEGRETPAPGEQGELVYRGANVSMGYAESASDLARGDDNRGVLRTGDMAVRDADGYYYIVGRKSRFLKIFGNRVSLTELEKNLKKAGFDCVCAGVDDKLKVFIPTPEHRTGVDEYLRERTAINRKGYAIYVMNELPRGEAGKILYGALNAWED